MGISSSKITISSEQNLHQQNKKKQSDSQNKFEPSHIFLISTHHGRLVCFLNLLAFLNDQKINTGFNDVKSKKGLQNLATIKFYYDPAKCRLQAYLFFSGIENINKKDKYQYWTKSEISYTFKGEQIKKLFPNVPIIFYMFRHGLGEHNLMKSYEKIYKPPFDALLINSVGIEHLAKNLKSDLKKYNVPITLISSPLLRTIETMALLITYMDDTSFPYEIYILPCLHEFASNEKKIDGRCDTNQNNLKAANKIFIFNAENKSKCIMKKALCTNFQNTFPKKVTSMAAFNTLNQISKETRNNLKINWMYFNDKSDCRNIVFTEFFQNFIKKS